MEMYDLIIIGGGPAGLTAGLYASRGGLKTVLLEKNFTGGPVMITEDIENFPGFPGGVKSQELIERMTEQAKSFGLELKVMCDVKKLKVEGKEKTIIADDDGKDKEMKAQSVILATGTHPKTLGVPGEKEFGGKGVSYCATCDGPLFRDKKVLVIGGGNAAVEESLHIANFASGVVIVHRRDELRADKIIQDRVLANPKIDVMWSHELLEIKGDMLVSEAVVRDIKTGEAKDVPTDGVFIYVGTEPNTGFVRDMVELDDRGFIKTDERLNTSAQGVFAAGDCRANRLKQLVIAAGEGALAAVQAEKYLGHI
jgi:thioredoxin reductase (NADPH)